MCLFEWAWTFVQSTVLTWGLFMGCTQVPPSPPLASPLPVSFSMPSSSTSSTSSSISYTSYSSYLASFSTSCSSSSFSSSAWCSSSISSSSTFLSSSAFCTAFLTKLIARWCKRANSKPESWHNSWTGWLATCPAIKLLNIIVVVNVLNWGASVCNPHKSRNLF